MLKRKFGLEHGVQHIREGIFVRKIPYRKKESFARNSQARREAIFKK